MRLRLLLAMYVLFLNIASAQEAKEYSVKAGEIPAKVLPNEAMYVLPSFSEGTASFKNGTSSTIPFNYDFLLDEMHFINGSDTLAIADPENLQFVIIDSMSFYYDKGYVRQIFKQGYYKLAVKEQMVQLPDKKKGGYDMSLGTGSIQTYSSINGNNQIYRLTAQKDVLFKKDSSFCIADSSNHFLKANKKNFSIVFAGKKMTKYLKEHKIDFNKEEDLKTFLQFCAE